MLIIPFDRKIDWRRPPAVIIALVLINSLIYFGFQLGDDAATQAAWEHYYEQGLAEIELPRYAEYLRLRGESEFVRQWEDDITNPESPWFFTMLGDAGFRRALSRHEVVRENEAEFAQWQTLRTEFDALLQESVTFDHGLKPAAFEWTDMFAHMFLHGGVMHLVGNMFFLFAVGFLVEGTLGWWRFAIAYLLGGLGSAGLDLWINADRIIPGVGASGAIAAVMGMYAVLFGLRKVNFFYWIGPWFNYTKGPALLFLPAWLGYEVFQQLVFADQSNVNYIAHIGGFIAGGSLGFIFTLMAGAVDVEFLEAKARQEARDKAMAEVDEAMRALDYGKARLLLKPLVLAEPDNRDLLERYYEAGKMEPRHDEFHEAAQRIFDQQGEDKFLPGWKVATFVDYAKRAKPHIRLKPRHFRALTPLLLRAGKLAEAEELIRLMASRPQQFPQGSTFLLRLAKVYRTKLNPERAIRLERILVKHYPNSKEAGLLGGGE